MDESKKFIEQSGFAMAGDIVLFSSGCINCTGEFNPGGNPTT